ncbi:hotdog domain-containing protein [Planomicrobium okeanokoites]|uniref:hotdog domain-containing protein n=1 Tax=Planomicrobium okeanokoites TaxID=244 RepID=UPI0009FD86B3|nr:hotdog domain-containing protein [Planomicrobium okeanokoites]
MMLKAGETVLFERTFKKEDVELFTKVSNDEGEHHLVPDELGRLVVHGLLTATIPSKVGGDHSVLARTMNFEFLRPVFTGDTIFCEVLIEHYGKREDGRFAIKASFRCRNQLGKEVLLGNFAGIILKEKEESAGQ